MIGIMVVTHGRVAEELVNATRNIVGDIPAIRAVSIGWSDDPGAANAAIEEGLAASGGGPVLVLTDMFGGTPTNVSLPFLSNAVEIVTGVNLPMVVKARALAREGKDPSEMARTLVEKGRRAIVAAGELMETEKRSA